jgi:tetratricopeptide (TPR) repeat protein
VSDNQTLQTGNKSDVVDADVIVEKGLTPYNMSNYEDALLWFDKALAIDPDNPFKRLWQ